MDPVEVRDERVATGTAVAPATVAPAATGVVAQSTTVSPVGYRFTQLVWLIVGILDVILALDFIFRLAKANNTGFVNFIYTCAQPLAAPFDGIFGVTVSPASYIARWGDIVAIVIYTLIGIGVTTLIRILMTPRRPVVA